MPRDLELDRLIQRVAEESHATAQDDSRAPELQAALDAYRRYVKQRDRQHQASLPQLRKARRVKPLITQEYPPMSETTEASAMHDTEMTAEERSMATFEKEKAECDRFIAEFGGEYNGQGIRHRVMLYYEDMRRIAEMCRFFRDTAIGESTQVDEQ
jgi:hypothetical protein